MSKKITVVLLILVSMFYVFAQSSKEVVNDVDKEVNLAVMQGPTGFSSAMLPSYIDVSVYPSPNEAVAKIINGELDMAVLPANTAANLYNKGIKIKMVAIVGEGMLSLIGSDDKTEVLNVPGAGGTPDHMALLLYPEYKRDYSITAPAQLAQMLIAGKCKAAILPQPFVNMVLNKNSSIHILDDVQKRWKKAAGVSQYPMSVLVVSQKFAAEQSELVENVKSDYRKSIEKVLSDTRTAAKIIEEKGIMKAELAEPSIKDCAIVFKDGKTARNELQAYFEILNNLAPDAIGSKIPDFGFYK